MAKPNGQLAEVIPLDSARPHTVTTMMCEYCYYFWVAVHPVSCTKLECKGCGHMQPIEED